MLRFGRSIWAIAAFLVGFSFLIWIVSNEFLIPAMSASSGASDIEKRQLVAYSRLLLAIVLVILCVGILIVFRMRRSFAAASDQRAKTQYIDAWAEAGKRIGPG
ncbi:MAG TPA: hypothetical protein VHD56_00155 [Tepidisphaeraceae bacterium]|nr:hypothetical protein [Tepidisphaeraceae bacterium]